MKRKIFGARIRSWQQAVKYFATAEIEQFAHDEAWLSRATKTMYNH